MSYIKNNFAGERNYIDAALSVRDVYFALLDIMKKQDGDLSDSTESGMIGIGWATTENALRPCHELKADVVKTVFLHGELNGEVAEVVSLEVNVIEG